MAEEDQKYSIFEPIIVEDLQHDVFRSSVEAIKVWLGAENVVRVGQWPDLGALSC